MAKTKKQPDKFYVYLNSKGVVVNKEFDYCEELLSFHDDTTSAAVIDFIKSEIPEVDDCTKFTITATRTAK